MTALLTRSRTSTPTAALVGIALGIAVLVVYVIAGLLLADWSVTEFVTYLSLEVVGWLVLATVASVSVVAIPVAAYLRYALYAPILVLGLVVVGWVGIGISSGILSTQSVFGLALYAAMFSPLYVVLYGILGASEYYLRRSDRS